MTPTTPDETIAAVASAPGGAMRSIIRLSGLDLMACLQRCFRHDGGLALGKITRPTVIDGHLALIEIGAEVPAVLYLWPDARSYTRQPMAELHTIGSPPLVDAALHTVCAAGARMAEPGEFTLRAFLGGRLDLPQAEAVLGVIDAKSQHELDVALSQLAGGLSGPLNSLRDRLLDLLADVEAGLDFVDEDIELISAEERGQRLEAAEHEFGQLLGRMTSRALAGNGHRVVLMGSPNVGKSSLLNALAAESAAIVADGPGTTRDYVVRRFELEGMACDMVDTAGIVPITAQEKLQAAAQDMSRRQAEQAHLQILCLDSTRKLNDWERAQLELPSGQRLLVLTKCDGPRRTDLTQRAIETSSVTGRGLDQLQRQIVDRMCETSHPECGVVAETAARCQDSLRLARQCLQRCRELNRSQAGEELVAVELRTALEELGKMVGAVYTEDVLDRVFLRFCIGK